MELERICLEDLDALSKSRCDESEETYQRRSGAGPYLLLKGFLQSIELGVWILLLLREEIWPVQGAPCISLTDSWDWLQNLNDQFKKTMISYYYYGL